MRIFVIELEERVSRVKPDEVEIYESGFFPFTPYNYLDKLPLICYWNPPLRE